MHVKHVSADVCIICMIRYRPYEDTESMLARLLRYTLASLFVSLTMVDVWYGEVPPWSCCPMPLRSESISGFQQSTRVVVKMQVQCWVPETWGAVQHVEAFWVCLEHPWNLGDLEEREAPLCKVFIFYCVQDACCFGSCRGRRRVHVWGLVKESLNGRYAGLCVSKTSLDSRTGSEPTSAA